jgi:hypothetical protein
MHSPFTSSSSEPFPWQAAKQAPAERSLVAPAVAGVALPALASAMADPLIALCERWWVDKAAVDAAYQLASELSDRAAALYDALPEWAKGPNHFIDVLCDPITGKPSREGVRLQLFDAEELRCREARDASGYTAARQSARIAEEVTAGDLNSALLDLTNEIATTSQTTDAGRRAKLRVMVGYVRRREDVDPDLKSEESGGWAPCARAILSLAEAEERTAAMGTTSHRTA